MDFVRGTLPLTSEPDSMTGPLSILVAGLASALASGLCLPLGSIVLYFVGQVLGVGTLIAFLFRRRETELTAGLGFALALAAVAVPDLFLLAITQMGVD